MPSPFRRHRRAEKRNARQAAEIAAALDLPPITMAGPANVRATEVLAEFDEVTADDDATEYPKVFGAPEKIVFKFGE
jgi:hypothetical protein